MLSVTERIEKEPGKLWFQRFEGEMGKQLFAHEDDMHETFKMIVELTKGKDPLTFLTLQVASVGFDELMFVWQTFKNHTAKKRPLLLFTYFTLPLILTTPSFKKDIENDEQNLNYLEQCLTIKNDVDDLMVQEGFDLNELQNMIKQKNMAKVLDDFLNLLCDSLERGREESDLNILHNLFIIVHDNTEKSYDATKSILFNA